MKRDFFIPFLLLFIMLASSVSAAEGFLVLSSGKADFVSNDPSLSGKWWLVTVSQNGAGQSLVGTFSTSQFTDTTDGVKAKYPLTISASTKREGMTWVLEKQSETVKPGISGGGYDTLSWYNALFTSDATLAAQCAANHPEADATFYAKTQGVYDKYCVYFTNTRPIATASATSHTYFDVLLSATTNGSTVSADVTDKSTSVWLGNVVQAQWAGSLLSLNTITFPSNKLFVWVPNSGTWQMIDSTPYTTYVAAKAGLKSCLETTAPPVNCLNDYVSKKNAALAGTSISIPGATQQSVSGNASSGIYDVATDFPLQFPVLTMKVKAEWLGIVQLVGVPKIDGLGSQTNVNTGNALSEQVMVRNTGSYQGTFDVFATCAAPLSSTARVRTTVNPGQVQSVFIPIMTATSTDVQAKCTFTAVDVNNPNNKDTLSKTYTAEALAVCTPDAQRCNGLVIERCATDGGKYVPLQTCTVGCSEIGGVGRCTESCTPSDSQCIDGVTQVCKADGKGYVPTSPATACSQECTSSFYGLIQAQTGNAEVCDFWCKIGLSQPKVAKVCVKDYTPLVIVLMVLAFIAFLAIYKQSKGKKGKRGSAPAWLVGEHSIVKSKVFWIGIAVLLGFALIVGFFAYFFWALVAAAVLAIIYLLIRIFVFKKIW